MLSEHHTTLADAYRAVLSSDLQTATSLIAQLRPYGFEHHAALQQPWSELLVAYNDLAARHGIRLPQELLAKR